MERGTRQEIFEQNVMNMNKNGCRTDEWVVFLLTSIARSNAIILDILEKDDHKSYYQCCKEAAERI